MRASGLLLRLMVGMTCAAVGVVVLSVGVAFGASPEPPEVRVEPVFATTATFDGVLNPHAVAEAPEPGVYQFVFRESAAGECKGAGEKKAPASAASAGGQPGEAVAEVITALKPSTEYAVCLVAENKDGKAISSPASFKTAAGAPVEVPEVAVEGHVPTPTSPATEAIFRGLLNPSAVGPVEPGSYQFVYRQTADGKCEGPGEKLTAPGVAFGLPHEELPGELVRGLTAGTEYAVCVLASSDAGEKEVSAAVSFETAIEPQQPETSALENVTADSAMVTGVLSPKSAQTAGWHVAYSNPEGASCTEGPRTGDEPEVSGQAVVVGPTEIAGLEPHQTYVVCIVATNSAGEEVIGNEVSFETLASPPVIVSESVSSVTFDSATLQAFVDPNNQSTSYSVQYSTEATGETLEGAITTLNGATPLEGFAEQTASVETGANLTQDTTYFYRVIVNNAKNEEVTGKVAQFTTLPEAPENVEVSDVTGSSATVKGVLNPNKAGEAGADYEFLYQAESESECENGSKLSATSAGGKAETVEAHLTGLKPNTKYAVCLRVLNGGGQTATSAPPVTFETPPSPVIASESSSDETINSADVKATINPDGSLLTRCAFEYGTSASYGQETPCAQSVADIGAGSQPVPVSATLTGLLPGKSYHWRVATANGAGETVSVDHTFVVTSSTAGSSGCEDEAVRQQERSSALPDCRAYEMVTPPIKNGALVNSLFADDSNWGPLIAGDGRDIMAPSIQCLANTESCTGKREVEGEPYEFARTSQGWVTRALAPPATQFGVTSQWGANADSHTTLFSAASSPEVADDFYLRKEKEAPVKIGPVSEAFEALGGSGIAIERLAAGSIPIEATSDLSHVLFMGHGIWSLDGPENGPSIYEYAGQGRAKPLSVGVTGSLESTDLISECGTRIGGEELHTADAYNSLSEDGRVVYFAAVGHDEGCPETTQAPAVTGLYARIDGERSEAHTVLISAPTASSCKSGPCQAAQAEPQNAEFEGASRDGSRVFFTSAQQLSDDASQGEGVGKRAGRSCGEAGGSGCNLYESVCTSPCGSHGEELAAKERVLIDVSAGARGHGGPRVQGVMAISSDGSHVYFVARGKLAGNPGVLGSGAQEGQDNLYVYAAGQPQPLRFIATLPPADEELFEHEKRPEWAGGIELANVTPDGRFLVFVSHAALTADDTRPVGPGQIYRYDSQTNQIVRVSIGQDGFNDNGNASSAGAENAIVPASRGWNYPIGPGRADPTMSDDGEDVFFESPVALTPGALNEVNVGGVSGFVYAENVYEYHDGTVSLISDGRDVTPNSSAAGINTSTRLVGTDPTGKNVFFATNDQLTPQDTDTQRDYYDARICEETDQCVLPPSTSSEACQEDACRGPATGGPPVSVMGSSTLQGTGNLAPTGPAAARPRITILTRSARGGKFAVRAKLTVAGRLTITGRDVARASQSFKAAGTHALKITLTRAAQRTLRRSRKLTLRLRVTYAPQGAPASVSKISVLVKL